MASDMDLNSNTAAVPIGDGIHDDTAAIQALLDTGASLVELPAPKVSYIISRTLLIGDGHSLYARAALDALQTRWPELFSPANPRP